jgi:shikimate kinase
VQHQNPEDAPPPRVRPRNLVLIGFMGTGKSAIGRAIARQTGGRHVDTDYEIETLCGKKIARIFSEDGEGAFRTAEQRVVRRLAYTAGRYRAKLLIVSTGGGTPLRSENAGLLHRVGSILWLTASTETIVRRVTRNIDQRPLLAGYREDPASRIEFLVADRAPRYAALADYTVDTSLFASPDEAAKYVTSMLGLSEET